MDKYAKKLLLTSIFSIFTLFLKFLKNGIFTQNDLIFLIAKMRVYEKSRKIEFRGIEAKINF